jgi:hypothetical protein
MTTSKTKLVIRNATPRDIPAILPLYEKVYGVGYGYKSDEIAGQINRFADGQFVAEFEGRIVGHCVHGRRSPAGALRPGTIPRATCCMAWM